ncbi:MAG TPA: hypothetical protein VHL59_11480 [Thermoanaerobaculia bacterium]|nr:hypothetical protein [Thermoanaerobaculia bacterium]
MAKQHAAAALLFVALAVAFTWPLTPNLGRAVADPGDPYLNIWILDWDWWATLHQPFALFHANAVHPAKYSLAFSEHLYGIAVLLFPLRMAGVTPIAAYNVAMLAGFALCGFGAYLLGRRLTGSWIAGLAAGIFYAFVPFRFLHTTHIQHVWGGWLPLMLVALLAYAERPSRKRAALFAAMFAMNGLTNIHYLFFGAFAALVTAALLVPRRAWRDLALALVIAGLVLAPFLYPYAAAAKLYGIARTYQESLQYSAIPSDWIGGAAGFQPAEPERRIDPGVLPFVIGLAAFLAIRREWPKIALALLWIAIGFAGSLGMHSEFHSFLFGAVPGFRAIRVPARWAVIAYVGIAILIAVATALLARRSRWVALVVPAALAFELWQAPIRWYLAVPQPPPVYDWLAKSGRSPFVELPLDTFGSEYLVHLRSTVHHRPMANGVQHPPARRELSALWAQTPIPDAFVDALARSGVELAVVHADILYQRAPAVREWLRRELDRGRLSYVRDFTGSGGGDWVFALRGGGPRPPRLEAFLAGDSCAPNRSFVALGAPAWGTTVCGSLAIAGWAGSPHGIRYADIYFNNRALRHRVNVERDPRCLFSHRFFAGFPERPDGVRVETDVQVDVTDEAGNVLTSENRWFRWE